MKAALFGYYGEHNFGDDLMAVIFSRFLRQCNIEFSVYKLHNRDTELNGSTVADSLESLLFEKDVVIYGGGGVLCDMARTERYQAERRHLVNLAKQKGIPVYGISLGGDGSQPRNMLPFLKEFLQSVSYMSVRNNQDVHWVKKVNTQIKVDYFSDIVWQTSACFPRQRKDNQRLLIGIDIHAAPFIESRAIYVPVLLSIIARIRRDIDFVIFGVLGKKHNIARLKLLFGHAKNIRYHQFDRIDSDVDALSSLDLLISTRLHTGVACMSYGIPFVSLFGASKTKLFLDNLHLSSVYYENRNIMNICSKLLSPSRLLRFLENYMFPELNTLQQDSLGNFEMLKTYLFK